MVDTKRASRLFALTTSARERGDHFAADELTKMAHEALERDERPVVQQQQRKKK
jgi:hypothetical protein